MLTPAGRRPSAPATPCRPGTSSSDGDRTGGKAELAATVAAVRARLEQEGGLSRLAAQGAVLLLLVSGRPAWVTARLAPSPTTRARISSKVIVGIGPSVGQVAGTVTAGALRGSAATTSPGATRGSTG